MGGGRGAEGRERSVDMGRGHGGHGGVDVGSGHKEET